MAKVNMRLVYHYESYDILWEKWFEMMKSCEWLEMKKSGMYCFTSVSIWFNLILMFILSDCTTYMHFAAHLER